MEIKNIFLKNGLQVILKKEKFSKVSVVDILYKVGSKNDPESKKGLAHLFEHLMFCGSKNVKSYDEELQNVGGSNNAYTNFADERGDFLIVILLSGIKRIYKRLLSKI